MKDQGLADAVILDDGFQHRRLCPAYNIVLVDATQPVDRDLLSATRATAGTCNDRLQAAQAVIITRCPDALTKGDLRLWRHRLHMKPEQLLLHSGTMVEGLRDLRTKRYAGWPRNCIAVSGIAHPAQFEASLSRNCKVSRHFIYPDHHIFKPEEVEEWRAALKGAGYPEAMITTEKDAARLRNMA